MLSLQNVEIQTEPPKVATFSNTANQWIIYDSYKQYERSKETVDEDENCINDLLKDRIKKQERLLKAKERLLKSARIMERMVVQEAYKDLAFGKLQNYDIIKL